MYDIYVFPSMALICAMRSLLVAGSAAVPSKWCDVSSTGNSAIKFDSMQGAILAAAVFI
jgi:hypothetical protein